MKKIYTLFIGLILCSLFLCKDSYGAVTVTNPTLNFTPYTAFPSAYQTLGDIVIDESLDVDFSIGTNITLILTCPANFEFQAGVGTVSYTSNRNITAATIVVTSTTITVTYSVDAVNKADVLTISGIKVRATGAATNATITRTGGTGVIAGDVNGQVHGTLSADAAPCTPPSTQATAFTSSAITSSSITVGWVRGNGNNVIVVARAGSAPTPDPVNGTTYTGNAAYGAGTACGGGFVVYNGNGSNVVVTTMSSSTTYYFAIYEYNTVGTCYNLTELTGNATTTAASFNGAFSGGTTFPANMMTVVNDATNYWIVGTATHNGAPNSAYITNDGSANAYTTSVSQVSHFYFDYVFPAGQTIITLDFDWKCTGESTYDGLKVFLVPTSTTPVAGTALATGQLGSTWYNLQSSWQHVTITLDAANAGTTGRLVFTWKNDASGGIAPPAAVDNIIIATSAPAPMSFVSCNVTQPNTSLVGISTTNNDIICIQVVTSGTGSPLSLTSFTLNANGTTAIADINAVNTATIYYTGTTNTYSAIGEFGSNTPTIASYNITGTQVLSPGTNYFWLVYDIKAGATLGDFVDAECTSLTVTSARTPSPVTAPSGNRQIGLAYCTSTSTSATSYFDAFSTTGGTTNITNNASGYSATGYGDFTSKTVTQMQTSSVNFATTLVGTTVGVNIWVDWNIDGDFVDAGETVYQSGAYLSTCTGSFSVPLTATPGTTRMRIRMDYNNTNPAICGSITRGETEDYSFVVTALPVCAGTPLGGTATAGTASFTCSGSTTITLTGYTVASGITLQWQSSPAGAGTWSDIAGATLTTYSTGTISASKDYRCKVTCTNSALFAYSSTATVTINANVPGAAAATPTPVCAGGTTALSLTGSTVANSTYQWQSSPNNSTWTNIAGATSSTYNATPLSNTYYRCVVTCTASATSLNSTSVLVNVTAPAYAAIGYTTSFESNWVNRCDTRDAPDGYWGSSPVTGENSWRRDDDGAAGGWASPTSYIYTPVFSDGARSARFHAGSASNGSIGTLDLYINLSTQIGTKVLSFDYINTSGTDKLEVQLSADGGTTFSTLQAITLSAAWATYSIDIASNSATCIIRFKATADYGSTDIGLDNVSIVGPCVGTPEAGTATVDNSTFCNSATPLLTLSGYTQAGGITFQWQSSPTNAPYAWSDIPGATTAVYSAPAIYQTTYYQCIVRCVSATDFTLPISVANIAQSIVSTNSPVSVACNGTANLTATTSGGTISWYSAATGGSILGTGSSYNAAGITANTTFYCAANSGSFSESGGMPANTGTSQSTSVNYGVVFNVTKAIILNSVTVYPNKKATLEIAYQNSAGVEQAVKSFANVTGNGLTPVVLALGWSIPIGTGYRLVLKTYTPGTGTGLTYSSSVTFPYSSTSGALSVTSSFTNGSTSTYTNYHFYNLNISIPCESSPRTPVLVNVTSGVTAPVCSANPAPASGASGICPVGTTISWDASTTACRAATGYRLYIGTDVAGTNLYNGLDVGNVTSYIFPTLAGGSTYYWTIVPYNTAGPATGCTKWSFSTAANPGTICNTLLGTGVTTVGALPYTNNNGTTENMVNDLTSSNLVSCGSTSYFTGEDMVWSFTPAVSGTITVNLTSSGSYTGLALYEGCPLAAGACGAPPGSCVGTAQSSTGDKTLTICVAAATTYYLILDSYASPTFNPYSKLTISAPTGTTSPVNDLPCSPTALALGLTTSGNNSCAGSTAEPTNPTCWTSGVRNTVWYTIVAPASGQISVKTETGTLTNTQIALYSGSCGALTAVTGACNNDVSGCGSSLASFMTVTGLVPGNTYYLVVDGAYDLQGTFTVQAIDPATMSFPVVAGQDCNASLPVCQTVWSVADPGYANTGATCDFNGDDNCTGGERASVWYTITMLTAGTLQFDILPSDYDGTEGSETDYDFLVWKIGGSGTITNCATIATNSAQGLVACNYSYLGVTGLYPGGGGNPTYNGGTTWDGAYEEVITCAAGDQYLLCVSNFTQSTAGFTIDFVSSGGTATINTTAAPPVLFWTGAVNTAWTNTGNWGGCNIPSCLTSAVINPSSNNPVVSTNQVVNDLTISLGATLTINAGVTLSVCGNFINNGTIVANGTIEFISVDPQSYTNSSTTPLKNVTMNQSTPSTLTLNSDLLLGTTGVLTLTSGKIVTGTHMVIVNNTAPAAVTAGTTNSYVEGNLRRYLLATGSYDFPVGHVSKGYQRANVNFTAATTITYLTAFFSPYATLPTVALTGCATTYNTAIDNGYWTITPFPIANKNSGLYTMTLYNLNYTNSGSATDFTIMSDHGAGWQLLNGDGSSSTCVASSLAALVRSNMRGFSNFGPAANTGPLPIDLLTFSGKNIGDKNLLEWVTATEVNNDYFIIEKSKEGVVFNELVKVSGAGNSNKVLKYNAVDDKPFSPVTYYKLKQVDFDGAYTYSDIITIYEFSSSDLPSFINLYPNPASESVDIELYSPFYGKVQAEIYDHLGLLVLSEPLDIKKGNNIVTFNISDLASGLYYFRVYFENPSYTGYKKFIKR